MKKLLLAGAFALAIAAPAFAGSISTAGITAGQETNSGALVMGNGSAIGGTVAGNYATVDATANSKPGSFFSPSNSSGAKVTEGQVGGTVSGGSTNGHAILVTGGSQNSGVFGFSAATSR
jgi:hypothetical protein